MMDHLVAVVLGMIFVCFLIVLPVAVSFLYAIGMIVKACVAQ